MKVQVPCVPRLRANLPMYCVTVSKLYANCHTQLVCNCKAFKPVMNAVVAMTHLVPRIVRIACFSVDSILA